MKFGGPAVGLTPGLAAGLVLHFVTEEAKVCEVLGEAIDRFARDCFAFDDSTDVGVSNYSKHHMRRKLGRMNAASLAKVFEPQGFFQVSAVGVSTMKFSAMRRGDDSQFHISFTVAKPDGNRADLDKLIEHVREFAETVEIVSGGIDLVHSFDWQEQAFLTNTRVGLERYYGQGLCLGYYWLTLLGPSLRTKLGAFPDDIEVDVVEGPNLLEIRLSEDPLDDERVTEVLPLVRSWLRPGRTGWYTSGRIPKDRRCYEGPDVPFEQAHYLRWLYEGIVDPLDPERMTPVADELDLEVPTDGMMELAVEFELLDEKFREYAEPGIIASVSALARGIDEGWLDYEPLTSWDVDGLKVAATGPAQPMRALVLIIHSLHTKFGAPVRDPANVVSLASISVSQVD